MVLRSATPNQGFIGSPEFQGLCANDRTGANLPGQNRPAGYLPRAVEPL